MIVARNRPARSQILELFQIEGWVSAATAVEMSLDIDPRVTQHHLIPWGEMLGYARNDRRAEGS
jgi:hypothetical protein